MSRFHNDPQLIDDNGRCWCTSCIVARRRQMDVDDYEYHYNRDEHGKENNHGMVACIPFYAVGQH